MINTSLKKIVACAVVAGIGAVTFSSVALAGEKQVKGLAAKKTAIVGNLHKKASKALVNSAQDKVFGEFFGGDASKKPEIDKLALSVQSKFHVDEMCLINDQGQEITRITGSELAPESDLSTEEASAPFFKPSFAQDVKQVYVSPAYISPDANKWVVAYVTPIAVDGKKVAILHYEHGLNVFQDALAKGVKDGTYVMAVNSDGYVIADTRASVSIDKAGEKEDPQDYFKKLEGPIADAVKLGGEGNASVSDADGNYLVAFKSVENWTIIAAEKQ